MSEPLPPQVLARQLRKPHGAAAMQVAERMSIANAALNRVAIALLDIRPGNDVLEIGPGNAAFARDMLATADVRYTGLDWSPDMAAAARARHQTPAFSTRTHFACGSSEAIPFAAATFDRVLCVNTLYFWTHPQRDLDEIARVLRPGGLLCLAFGESAFMHSLAFAAHGFILHEPAQLETWLHNAGFDDLHAAVHCETGPGNAAPRVEKRFHLLRARRA